MPFSAIAYRVRRPPGGYYSTSRKKGSRARKRRNAGWETCSRASRKDPKPGPTLGCLSQTPAVVRTVPQLGQQTPSRVFRKICASAAWSWDANLPRKSPPPMPSPPKQIIGEFLRVVGQRSAGSKAVALLCPPPLPNSEFRQRTYASGKGSLHLQPWRFPPPTPAGLGSFPLALRAVSHRLPALRRDSPFVRVRSHC